MNMAGAGRVRNNIRHLTKQRISSQDTLYRNGENDAVSDSGYTRLQVLVHQNHLGNDLQRNTISTGIGR